MSELFSYLLAHFWGFLFVFFRLSALFLAFPFFSTSFVPRRVKVVLLLVFSFFFAQVAQLQVSPPSSLFELAAVALKELLIGFLFALISSIFYGVIYYAGELISYLMGLTVANLFDPTFGTVSVLGRFFLFTFYAVFFATGGAEVFVSALYKSFEALPPGHLNLSPSLFKLLVEDSSLIFSLGFQMAFPFLFALFLTNLALALVNRLIPQINVFIVGLPLQLFVGLLLLAIGFSVVVYFMVSLSNRFGEELFRLLEVLKVG